jgi:hypothetical protein
MASVAAPKTAANDVVSIPSVLITISQRATFRTVILALKKNPRIVFDDGSFAIRIGKCLTRNLVHHIHAIITQTKSKRRGLTESIRDTIGCKLSIMKKANNKKNTIAKNA